MSRPGPGLLAVTQENQSQPKLLLRIAHTVPEVLRQRVMPEVCARGVHVAALQHDRGVACFRIHLGAALASWALITDAIDAFFREDSCSRHQQEVPLVAPRLTCVAGVSSRAVARGGVPIGNCRLIGAAAGRARRGRSRSAAVDPAPRGTLTPPVRSLLRPRAAMSQWMPAPGRLGAPSRWQRLLRQLLVLPHWARRRARTGAWTGAREDLRAPPPGPRAAGRPREVASYAETSSPARICTLCAAGPRYTRTAMTMAANTATEARASE